MNFTTYGWYFLKQGSTYKGWYVLQEYCVHSSREGDVYSSITGALGVEPETEKEKGLEKNQKINHDRNRCKL